MKSDVEEISPNKVKTKMYNADVINEKSYF